MLPTKSFKKSFEKSFTNPKLVYQISLAEPGTSDEYLRLLVWAESDMLNIVHSKWCVKVKQSFRQFKSQNRSVYVSKIVQAIHTCDSKVTRYWYGGLFPKKTREPRPDLRVHDHSPQFSALPTVSYWAPRMRNQRFGLLLQYLGRWFWKEKRPSRASPVFFQQNPNKSPKEPDLKQPGSKRCCQWHVHSMLFWPVENPQSNRQFSTWSIMNTKFDLLMMSYHLPQKAGKRH